MSDTLEVIKCPACGEEMHKIFIPEKGINIDICTNGCGGMYFDNQEIQKFSNADEDLTEIKVIIENKNFMPVDQNQKRICPICKIPMAKTNALGVQIDTCYKCGGIFLDNGEFEQIRTHFKKRQKVKPVNINNTSEINLRDFYREAQAEEEYEYEMIPLHKFRRSRYSLIHFLFDLIF